MDFFGILQLIGGLCLFLFGMETMGDGLKKASGSKLEEILSRLTSNEYSWELRLRRSFKARQRRLSCWWVS